MYIQVKSGMIYRVKELLRRDTSNEQKSTIRYFIPTETYTEKEFIEAIKTNTIAKCHSNNDHDNDYDGIAKPLFELWDQKYAWMIVRNVENDDLIYVNCNHDGGMFRDYSTGCVRYVYVDKYRHQSYTRKKEYMLSHQNEKRPIWILVKARIKI